MVLPPVDHLADPQPHVVYSNLLGSSTPLYNMVLHIYLDNDNTLGCTSPFTLIHGSDQSAHSVFGWCIVILKLSLVHISYIDVVENLGGTINSHVTKRKN
jgi:hypothetical protein